MFSGGGRSKPNKTRYRYSQPLIDTKLHFNNSKQLVLIFVPENYERYFNGIVSATALGALTVEAPSKTRSTGSTDPPPAMLALPNFWYVRKILHASIQDDKFEDILFASLRALMELHLVTPPRNVPFLSEMQHSKSILRMKFYECGPGFSSLVPKNAQKMWVALRKEVDDNRSMLPNLQRYIERHFNECNSKKTTLLNLIDRCDIYLKNLELAEASLRDTITMYSTEASTRMAELSIRESKRVLLRKYCHRSTSNSK
jgi:hypothetical protein